MATRVAPELERLPWLTDDRPQPRRRRTRGLFFLLSAVTIVGIATLSFWLGMNQGRLPKILRPMPEASVTVPVPAPVDPLVRQPEIAPTPQVQPVTEPQVAMPRMDEVRPVLEDAPPVRRMARKRAAASHKRDLAVTTSKAKSEPDKNKLQFTNPWESDGASGRMVRIGTYSSLDQGKQAWSRLARAFPGMKKLPAVVTDLPSLRNGKVYYRLQIGTTSQAHSEVLCQRMRAIGQSCVVVDVAGARKDSGDERQPVGL